MTLPAFYACEHAESNIPDECFPPDDLPVPDDWFETYPSEPGAGLTDAVTAS